MISNKDAEEILKHEYHLDNFTYLVKELLLPDFTSSKHDVHFNNEIFQSVTQLGESSVCDLTVFEVYLNEGTQNKRVTITQEMFKILRSLRIDNAIVSFVNQDKNNYRISLLTSKYEYDGDKIVRILSNPRRFSYSLGFGTKTKTAFKYLISKGKVNSLEELTERFSVEVVNKQFYNEIALCYTKLVGGERDGKKFDKQLGLYSVVDQKKYAEFAVRLIGRITFCWFLKEKKSINGISLIPEELLSIDTINNQDNYYHKTLEPLFFEMLNTSQNRRKDNYQEQPFTQIPYLNGGLFSPHHDDMYEYDRMTGYGRYGLVNIPNEWFLEFYGILSQYNFTVDENTSYDIELSIDPEMLGRIFENLLAEINPETGENAKKSTGSFYTPRDIVDYMVDSSLCEYLKNKTNIDEVRLKALISYGKEDDSIATFDYAEKKRIIDALYIITVLDPACGSGAFPIGMLQKIVYILQEVDPGADLWFDKATENVSILLKKEFEKKFNAGSLNYIRKLSVIQNSIFGIDIQPIAVEISRLRCFLSLVIEENVNDEEVNRGINPLPNLDFKFVIANSLLKLEDDNQMSLFENQMQMDRLKRVREEYFAVNDIADKKDLMLKFSSIQNEMLRDTFTKGYFSSLKYQQLFSWKPFENEITPWFDPDWMFGIKEGFDIVIGNPPYIDSETMTKSMKELREIYSKQFVVAKGNWDIFLLFIELSIKLLKEKGTNIFILPNKLIGANYAKAARNLMSKYTMISVRDYSEVNVFESAAVYPIVYHMSKDDRNQNCLVQKMNNLTSYVFERYINQEMLKTSENWDCLFVKDSRITEIINKINKNGKLNEIALVKGSATVNEAYEIKSLLLDEAYDNDTCFKFINTGTIDKYKSLWGLQKTQYIKNAYNYPIIKKEDLKSLYPTRYDDAYEEKLIIGGMCKEIECFYDNGEYLAGKSTIIVYNSKVDLKIILGILNSKLLSVYYQIFNSSLSLAGGFYRFGTPQIKELPIAKDKKDIYNSILNTVNEILDNKSNINKLTTLIDDYVYELYDLTQEEIKLVEELYE